MYAAVPRITPTPVIIAGDVIVGEFVSVERGAARAASVAFARPKSSTLTLPSCVSAMLAGFRSR